MSRLSREGSGEGQAAEGGVGAGQQNLSKELISGPRLKFRQGQPKDQRQSRP